MPQQRRRPAHLARMRDDGGVTPLPRSLCALAGLVAGLAGIAVSHAVTMVLTIRATPLLAVAEAVVEITPGPLAESLIQVVGQYDKPLLIIGVTLGLLGLSAWAGALSPRGQAFPIAVFVLMGALGAAAAGTRPQASPVDVVPVVAGTLTWIVVLALLVDRLTKLTREAGAAEGTEVDPARRRFLVTAGAVAAGAVVVGVAGQLVGASRRGVEASRK
ncbi:MAG: hypothetical protein ACRDPR_07295, partial [Nocardioidaceae bacterium]